MVDIKKEDIREMIFVSVISVILFLLFLTSNLNPLLHEVGHEWTCELQGGTWNSEPYPGGYKTVCKHVEWTNYNAVIFSLGGVGFELIMGALFLALPFASPFGAFLILNTAINFVQGNYATDIGNAVKMFPALSFLKSPVFEAFFIALGFVLVGVAIYYLYWVIKQVNVPGV